MLKLQKKFIVYSLIILIVVLSIFIEVIFESGSVNIEKSITNTINAKKTIEEINIDEIMAPIRFQQKKMFVIVIILLILITLLFYHFANEIVKPLHKIITESAKVLNGDLTTVIELDSTDEIKDLGETINELTSNMQEVVVQIKNWVENIEKLNFEMEEKLRKTIETKKLNKREFQDLLKAYRENTALLDDFLKLFTIYKMKDGVVD